MTQGYQDHPLLPATAPYNEAHILEKGVLPLAGRTLGDFIATFLFNLDSEKHPDALKDFFDPDIKYFHLVRKFKDARTHHKPEFMIPRNEDWVIAGLFSIAGDSDEIAWRSVTKTRLSQVGPDAKWIVFWGAHEEFSSSPIEAVWKSIKQNDMFFSTGNPNHREVAKTVACIFGSFLFQKNAWEEDDESEIVIVTQK